MQLLILKLRIVESIIGTNCEYAAARETNRATISDLQRENDDLKKKYNRVTKNNMDVYPLLFDEPTNLLEQNRDLKDEVERLREDLQAARSAVPTPDVVSAHLVIAKLKAQENRCQKQKGELEAQISDLNDLVGLTDNDQTIRLAQRVFDLQDQLRATESERDELDVKARQLHVQNEADIAMLQTLRASLVQAHDDLHIMRTIADASTQSGQSILNNNETADAALRRLCIHLEFELRKMAAIPGILSIPRLVHLIPEDHEYLSVTHLDEFIDLCLESIPKLSGKKLTGLEDPDCEQAKSDIKLLCDELKSVFVRGGQMTQKEEVNVKDIQRLIQQVAGIWQHEEMLRRTITQLEEGKARFQTGICTNAGHEQLEVTLRNLNNQTLAALPKIGQQLKPSAGYNAFNYIDDSVMFIQTLLAQLASLRDDEDEDIVEDMSEAPPLTNARREYEFHIYNRLVYIYKVLYHVITIEHVNEQQPSRMVEGGQVQERDPADPAAVVTLLDIDQLIRGVGEIVVWIRQTRWPGSQPNWTASEADYGKAKFLSSALDGAGDIIVQATAFLDGHGPNFETDKSPSEQSPDSDATPSESVVAACVAAVIQMQILWTIARDRFNKETLPEGIEQPGEFEPLDKDYLYKVGRNMVKLMDWIRDRIRSTDNSIPVVFGSPEHCDRLALQHAFTAAETTLGQAQCELEGYIPKEGPAPKLSAAEKLRFKTPGGPSKYAAGGSGGPTTTAAISVSSMPGTWTEAQAQAQAPGAKPAVLGAEKQYRCPLGAQPPATPYRPAPSTFQSEKLQPNPLLAKTLKIPPPKAPSSKTTPNTTFQSDGAARSTPYDHTPPVTLPHLPKAANPLGPDGKFNPDVTRKVNLGIPKEKNGSSYATTSGSAAESERIAKERSGLTDKAANPWEKQKMEDEKQKQKQKSKPGNDSSEPTASASVSEVDRKAQVWSDLMAEGEKRGRAARMVTFRSVPSLKKRPENAKTVHFKAPTGTSSESSEEQSAMSAKGVSSQSSPEAPQMPFAKKNFKATVEEVEDEL